MTIDFSVEIVYLHVVALPLHRSLMLEKSSSYLNYHQAQKKKKN